MYYYIMKCSRLQNISGYYVASPFEQVILTQSYSPNLDL